MPSSYTPPAPNLPFTSSLPSPCLPRLLYWPSLAATDLPSAATAETGSGLCRLGHSYAPAQLCRTEAQTLYGMFATLLNWHQKLVPACCTVRIMADGNNSVMQNNTQDTSVYGYAEFQIPEHSQMFLLGREPKMHLIFHPNIVNPTIVVLY